MYFLKRSFCLILFSSTLWAQSSSLMNSDFYYMNKIASELKKSEINHPCAVLDRAIQVLEHLLNRNIYSNEKLKYIDLLKGGHTQCMVEVEYILKGPQSGYLEYILKDFESFYFSKELETIENKALDAFAYTLFPGEKKHYDTYMTEEIKTKFKDTFYFDVLALSFYIMNQYEVSICNPSSNICTSKLVNKYNNQISK